MQPPRILLAQLITILFVCSAFGASGISSAAEPSWTIMVYMANDSTNPLPSTDNINAMEAAPQTAGTNIIILLDEQDDGNSRILKVQHDSNLDQTPIVSIEVDDNDEVIGASNEVNTGSSSTLADFVIYCTSQWAADRYALILWGHGAGWDGLCLDRIDLLTLVELKSALTEVCSALGRPLDIVAVDACVEATIETLYQVKTFTNYFVAAQTNIPYEGLPYYQILSALAEKPGQVSAELARTIVDEYIEWSALNSQNSATLAVFDLSKMTALTNTMIRLSQQGLRYDSIFHSAIHTAMADSEYYGAEWTFDLGDFLNLLSGSNLPLEVKTLATEAHIAYSNMITHFGKFNHPDPIDGISVTNATGAVIYAPSTSPFDTRYLDLDLAGTIWDEFGKSARFVTSTNESAPGPQITYADADSDGKNDQATLAWPVTYPSVTAWIFRYSPHGMSWVKTLESSTGTISVTDIAGELMVAASASVNGSAVSYDAVTLMLNGISTIEVHLILDGVAVSEGYDVRVVSSNLIDYAVASEGKFYASLSIPTQAAVGQLVRMEVLDDNGEIMSSEHIFVPESYSIVDIELFTKNSRESADFNVLLLFSVLPGLFVLAYTVMMYVDFKKKMRKG